MHVEVGDVVVIDHCEFTGKNAHPKLNNVPARVVKKYENSAIVEPLVLADRKEVRKLGGDDRICVNYRRMSFNGREIAKETHQAAEFTVAPSKRSFFDRATPKKDAVIAYCRAHPRATAKEIGEHTGVNYSYVYKMLASVGLRPMRSTPYYSVIQPKLPQIKQMLANGYSLDAVSKALGQNGRYLSDAQSKYVDLKQAIKEGRALYLAKSKQPQPSFERASL